MSDGEVVEREAGGRGRWVGEAPHGEMFGAFLVNV
jgi:hypothetical protein